MRILQWNPLKQTTNKNPYKKNQLGVNLLMIRVLKNNTNTLVYIYIKYSEVFSNCLLVYLFNRTTHIKFLIREMAGFIAVIHQSLSNLNLLSNNSNDLYLNSRNIMDLFRSLEYSRDYSEFSMLTLDGEEHDPLKDHPLNSYAIVNLINRLNYLSSNKEMSNLIDLAYNKEYSLFIEKILSSIPNNKPLFDIWNSEKGILTNLMENSSDLPKANILHNCLFIVSDMDSFLNNVRAKGYNINAGSQAWRGQINSLWHSLTHFDLDFRNSLFNHYLHHYNKRNTSKYIPKAKFSFHNIHRNIGSVRWYTTRSSILNSNRCFATHNNLCNIKLYSPKNLNRKKILPIFPVYITLRTETSVTNSIYNYLHLQKKPIIITFSYAELQNVEFFISGVTNKITKGFFYAVIVKVRFKQDDKNEDNNYCMAGNNFGFDYKDENYITNLIFLQENVKSRMKDVIEVYELTFKKIVHLQVIFKQIESKFLNDLAYDDENLNLEDKQLLKTQVKKLPLTTDDNILDILITDVHINNGIFTVVNFDNKGNIINFIEMVNVQNNILSLIRSKKKTYYFRR